MPGMAESSETSIWVLALIHPGCNRKLTLREFNGHVTQHVIREWLVAKAFLDNDLENM